MIHTVDNSVTDTLIKKVCIIEDDMGLNRLIQKSLVREGFTTISALSIDEIIEELRSTPNILLLLDYLLPNTTSKEIINTLKMNNFQVPFIIMTGHGDERIAVEMMKMGARDYIIKDSGFLNILPQKVKKIYADIENERRLVQSEKLLRESEKRYQTLFNNVSVGIGIINFKGEFIEANQSILKLFRVRSMAELKNKCVTDWYAEPGDFSHLASALRQRGKVQDWEVILQRKSGKKLFVLLNADLIIQNREELILITCREITKRKMYEEALRQSEERFATAFQASPEGIMIYQDKKYTILEVNKSWERILGYSRDEAVGRSLKSLDIFLDSDVYENVIIDKTKFSNFENKEVAVKLKSGSLAFIHLIAEKIVINNESCILTIIQDVTQKKEEEQEKQKLQEQLRQSQKMEAIGRLAGGVAHDFNNLLTVIIGISEILISDLEETDAHITDIEEIKKAANRAATLTRQLLAFSRRQPLELRPLDINKVVANMEKMLNRIIGENIKLTTYLDSDIPMAKADEGQLEQVIMNIVVNAYDAMPAGGELTIRTYSIQASNQFATTTIESAMKNFICLSIEDNGVGMPDDVLEHIYEPFFTTKDPGVGTGLGLAVVYGIIKQHNGWIDVRSSPNKGTRFDIFIPQFEGELESEESERTLLAGLKGEGERILLVEDDKMVREFTTRLLRKNGYDVFVAEDAEKAEEIFLQENENFDLICTDVVLPNKNGLELADYILECKPDIPILLCSGYTDQKVQWDIIREKGLVFLNKPYIVTELLRSIRNAIDAK